MPSLPRVWGDRQRLVQVLYNLLSNASKFSRKWSTITVNASVQDLHVAVTVTDDGIGLAPERLPRIFSKFSRSDTASGADSPSYGLGLAICKGIAEAHGGRIWAESDGLGHGARFTFTIPTVDETPANTAVRAGAALARSAQAPARGEPVLAVDGDPQMLRYICSTLANGGYTPILTDDPDEVEQLLKAQTPSLVLLNLALPRTDGFEVMKQILRAVDVPVILLSGRDGDRYMARAFEMGAADYIVKPFSPTELLARIRAICGGGRSPDTQRRAGAATCWSTTSPNASLWPAAP